MAENTVAPQNNESSADPTFNGAKPTDEQDSAYEPASQPIESTFQISIKLPNHPYKTQTIVSPQDQAQDIRQSIIETPYTFQYSCFHLEHNGQRIPDFVDLSEIPSIRPDVELTLVEDPYTELDARLHILRVRDLLGAAGDRTDLVRGIDAGLTLHDEVLSRAGASISQGVNGSGQAGGSQHAISGYDIDAPGSVDAMLHRPIRDSPKTIKSLSLSPWNPPPYHLRAKGHLLYLQIVTNEGEQHQITSHVTGFYVNKSSNSKFDPLPRLPPKDRKAHSLLNLISKLSPSFEETFKSLQDFNASRDALAAFQPSNAIPASPWVVPQEAATLSAHVPDICRTQESFLNSGADNAETLRDWNEEFQTTRELPKATVQDRVFRERVTSKLFADYTAAATAGAALIARGEVAPMNPTENKDAQIFVYKNIFFSFGADGVGTFTNEGGDEAARVATGKDVLGVRTVNQLDIQGLSAPGTAVIDYMGRRLVAQSIVPGIFRQREPGEPQVDYGGVEGKDVVATNDVFVPLFKRLSEATRAKSHPVWDKDGKRHDLEASVETKGLIGTDGRKYVLDLYRISPLDVSWIDQHWVEPQPENDIQSTSDGYLHRMTVLRLELVEAYWKLKLREYIKEQTAKSTPSQQHEKELEAPQEPKTNGDGSEHVNGTSEGTEDPEGEKASEEKKSATSAQDTVDISGFSFAMNPDVFSGQEPQTEEEKEEWAKDEAVVRAACAFLHDEVMPRLIQDLRDGDVGFPMDGQSLSALLHKRGINIRYLGKIAELASRPEPRLQALKALIVQEMISRAFKHIANRQLRVLPSPFATSCLSHLLNCLLGAKFKKTPQAEVDQEMRAMYSEEGFEFENLTPESLKEQISDQVRLRYRYELPSNWQEDIKHLQLLREVALKIGLQLGAKVYNFGTTTLQTTITPEAPKDSDSENRLPNEQAGASGKKKKKNADKSPNSATESNVTVPEQTFHPEDIFNIVAVVKDSAPKSILAEETLEAGRISVIQQQRELGQELLLESLTLHEQIYGILHPEVARVYYQLSTSFYGFEDKAVAVELARKAVIVSERVLGVDSHETLLAYLNLGLFEHSVGNTITALVYIRHALDLWKLIYGVRHPDSITTINNAAVMLQNLKLYRDSRLWFEASLSLCQDLSGPSSVNTATLLFQLAQALALDQDSKGAVNRMREAYNIFNSELGSEDRNTKEAETWLEQLTHNAVSIAKHANLQAKRMQRLKHLPSRVTLGTRATPQVGQSASADPAQAAATAGNLGWETSGLTAGNGVPPKGIDERRIEDLVKFIGVDEKETKTTSKKSTTNPKRRTQKVR